MKTMLLIPHVAGGGGERVFAELARHLEGEVVIAVFEKRFTYSFARRVVSLEAPIARGSILRRARGVLTRVLRFRRLLRAENPDVVLSFMGEANLLNALLSPNPVLTVHNHLSSTSRMRSSWESSVVNLLVRRLYRRATVVAVSEAVRQDLLDAYGLREDRVVVIHNAIDVSAVRQASQRDFEPPWNESLPVVVTVGRLAWEKGHWHLVRAFSEIRSRHHCQLVIVGSGDLDAPLRQLCGDLGIDTDTYFLGWKENPFAIVARSTVFVLPSLTEGFGLALLEAMACGIPVIATDCPGGVREVVAPSTGRMCGLLVPQLDGVMHDAGVPLTRAELELSEVIERVIGDESLRGNLAEAGEARVRECSYETVARSYRELLQATANSRSVSSFQ